MEGRHTNTHKREAWGEREWGVWTTVGLWVKAAWVSQSNTPHVPSKDTLGEKPRAVIALDTMAQKKSEENKKGASNETCHRINGAEWIRRDCEPVHGRWSPGAGGSL
jgi:hypothetical protein